MAKTNLLAAQAAPGVSATALIKHFAAELAISESDLRLIKNDSLNAFLDIAPRPEWLRKHPIATREVKEGPLRKKVPLLYIPIDRIKMNLNIIFGDWDWQITNWQVIANAVAVSGSLIVTHPLTGRTIRRDGIGAVAIQVKSGSAPTDFSAINSDAIHKNLPAANAYALKNAARNFGKLFGSELNIDDNWEFGAMYSDTVDAQHEEFKVPDDILAKMGANFKEQVNGN